MRKILQKAAFIGAFAFGSLNAQTYLTENFDGAFTGTPAAPAGWTQTRTILLGDGTPEATATSGEKDWEQNVNTGLATWSLAPGGIYPNAAMSGSTALFMNDYNFGSTGNAFGSRRMQSPNVNLLTSTNPYIRFWYFCGYSSTSMLLRVVASNNGGTTWEPIMFIAPNADVATFSSTSPWQQINVKIPAAYKVGQARFALEMSNTWGVQTLFIDDFSIEEFTPTTITSATSGGWSNPATWVGGIVPNANNHVVIAATHTVQTDVNIARMQNVTVNGVFQYSTTSTTQLNQIYGDLTVASGGLYFSGNTTTGKRTYVGGNLTNNGTIDFQPGTSATGALVWCGYSSNYSGAGVINNNRIPIVVHAVGSGVQYSNPLTISNTCALYNGTVNATNLTLGNPPAAAAFLTDRLNGSFLNSPTFLNTNVTQRNLTYLNPINGQGGITLGLPQVTVTPGNEVEIIGGSRQVTGQLTMNTHNNLVLTYPLSVGTATGTQNITLSRGIITTTTLNLLTLNASAVGATGTLPTTITSTGINGGNQGSYVDGPVKINFPSVGTGNRTFPLGVGSAFHTNLPSANARREIVLSSGGLAWISQTITATIENAPTGAVTGTLTAVMGNRSYRLNMNGGPGLGANSTVQLAYNNSSFGGNDNLVGTFQDIRIVQSAALNGPWTERSLTTGLGPITGDTPGTRVTTSLSPGPINNGDQYFAWGSTSPICSGAPTAGTISGNNLCSGAATTLSLTGATAGVGITYQWQSSTVAAGPYTNMGSALTQTTGTLATTMYYIVTTSCSISNSVSTTPEFTLVVNPNPTISVAASSTAICIPSTASVNLNASGATSYTWSPAASLSSSTGISVVASPTNNTIYSVVGSFSTGCSASNTIAISANPNPSVIASVTSATVCANSTLALAASSPSVSYCQPVYSTGTTSGDYIGGVQLSTITNTTTGLATPFYTLYPTSANTTATLTAGNTYTLYLNPGTWSSSNGMAAWIDYNQNGNLADLGEKLGEVTINGAFPTFSTVVFTVPANSFNGTTLFRVREVYATTNIDPCASATFGETEDYMITIVGGASQFSWTPSTYLNSSTGSTVISTPAASTNYTVSTTVNGCVGLATSSVVALITPVAITGNTAICNGGTVNLTASGADTYTWSTSANTTTISVTPTVSNTYTASGTSTLTGCVGVAVQNVSVTPMPTVSVSGSSVICSGTSGSLTANGATTYTWNTASTNTTIVVTPSVNTTYTVTGANGTCTNSAVKSVSIIASPTVSAASSATSICAGQTVNISASGAATYSWNTSSTSSVIAVSPSVTTSYTVTGTAANSCSNSFVITQSVSACLGLVNNVASLIGVVVYPNPNTGLFTIELNNGSFKTIEVMDLTGRIVLANTSSNDKIDFNINTLSNGVYFVKVQSNNSVEVIKIVKQ